MRSEHNDELAKGSVSGNSGMRLNRHHHGAHRDDSGAEERSIKVSEVRMIDDGSIDDTAVTARHWHPRGGRGQDFQVLEDKPCAPCKLNNGPWNQPLLQRLGRTYLGPQLETHGRRPPPLCRFGSLDAPSPPVPSLDFWHLLCSLPASSSGTSIRHTTQRTAATSSDRHKHGWAQRRDRSLPELLATT
jgi:hypothetical protein